MCLLLGATGVGKTLLLKRLQKLSVRDGTTDLGEPPVTLPTVGTNLTDLTLKRKRVTVRELGGCMGPIWPSYYTDCSSVIFMVDSANTTQVVVVCIQLLSVLSAEPLPHSLCPGSLQQEGPPLYHESRRDDVTVQDG
nr:ADP-ribosylation factor-like protein 16 [Salvelinus alpinus]